MSPTALDLGIAMSCDKITNRVIASAELIPLNQKKATTTRKTFRAYSGVSKVPDRIISSRIVRLTTEKDFYDHHTSASPSNSKDGLKALGNL
jgi:hypothetical protein